MENTEKVIELLIGQLEKLEQLSSTGNLNNYLNQWEKNTSSILKRALCEPNFDISMSRSISWDGDNYIIKGQLRELVKGYIDEFRALGLVRTHEKHERGGNITISNNININLVVDVLKNELSGNQIKELREAYTLGKDFDERKQNVLDTLKKFGIDIASKILSTILTNPSVIGSL